MTEVEKIDERYPEEELGRDYDDGTMRGSLEELRAAVVGHRIVRAYTKEDGLEVPWFRRGTPLILELDNGRTVAVRDTDDCCAYTEIEEFLVHVDTIDHVILGVGTTDGYQTWHIYADLGDVLEMKVGWSCGNPFYYGYGFDIRVEDPPVPAEH